MLSGGWPARVSPFARFHPNQPLFIGKIWHVCYILPKLAEVYRLIQVKKGWPHLPQRLPWAWCPGWWTPLLAPAANKMQLLKSTEDSSALEAVVGGGTGREV